MEAKERKAASAAAGGATVSVFEDEALRDAGVELERARGEFRLGHLDAAAKLLDELALRLKPRISSPEIAAAYGASRVLDARIHEQQRRSAECQQALEEAMAAYGPIVGHLDHLVSRTVGDYGIGLEMLGRHEEAADWLQRARDRGLDTHSTFHYLGLAQKALGRPEAAASLAEAEKRDPGDVVAIVERARILDRRGERDAAAEAYWRACVIAFMRGGYRQALKLVDQCSRLRPENAKDVGVRGAILWKLGKHPEALERLERAIQIAPPDLMVQGVNLVAAAWRLKGRILLEMRRFEDALPVFDEAIRLDRTSPLAIAGKAKALIELNRPGEALPLLKEALERDPKNLVLLVDKAELHRTLQQFDEAMETIEQALRAEPNSVGALYVCGRILQDRHQYGEAASRFRVITGLDPSLLSAWLDLSDALRCDGQPQEALEALEQAPAPAELAPPEAARIETLRGQALSDTGKLAEAAEAFRKSYALVPTMARLLHLVDTLRELGSYENAFAVTDKYLAEHPQPPAGVLLRKARLLCDVGEFAPAYEALADVDSNDPAIFTMRGWALENRGLQFAKLAFREYRQAARREPARLWTHYHIANALRAAGRRRASARIYSRIAAELVARTAALDQRELWLLGWSYLCQGRGCEAVRYLTAAASVAGTEIPQFDLALAFLTDGRFALAEREYAGAVERLKEIPALRCRGLLLVALQDLAVACRLEPEIPEEVGRRIRERLEKAAEAAPRVGQAATAGGARG